MNQRSKVKRKIKVKRRSKNSMNNFRYVFQNILTIFIHIDLKTTLQPARPTLISMQFIHRTVAFAHNSLA